MPLEPLVKHLSDLNPLWPLGADPASISDDNHRNIKNALLNDFAGFMGAVLVTGADGGGVNAYTLAPATTNQLQAMSARMLVEFTPVIDNTGPSTINISGLGAVPITSIDGAVLAASDLRAGVPYIGIYDGTQLRLASVTKRYLDNLAISANYPPPPNDGRIYMLQGLNGSTSYKPTPVGATMQAYNLGAL
jgi:hypothetical protein